MNQNNTSEMYNVVFHDWIYLDYSIAYYGSFDSEGVFNTSDSIHFVSESGYMTNRHHELVQLAII